MRVDNTMGFSPHGRRLGRGLVALVAISAICLSAATVSAAPTNYSFQVVQNQSSLGFVQFFGVHADNSGDDGLPYPHFVPGDQVLGLDTFSSTLSGFIPPPGGPYPFPGNVAEMSGAFNAVIDTGVSIQLTTSAIAPVASQAYYPYRTGPTIVAPPGGTGVGGVSGKLAQYGLAQYSSTVTAVDNPVIDGPTSNIGWANIYDLTQAFAKLSDGTPGGAAMPFAGGNTYIAGDLALFNLTGTEDLQGAQTVAAGISGVPSPIGGGIDSLTANVTFDGTYITIPVTNRITFVDSGILYDIRTFGQIVGVVVPEPSSVALLGCGAIGLVGYVIRRKRRA